MGTPDREHIAARCGKLMASLHSTNIEGLEAIAMDWPSFVEKQIQECIDQLPRSGMSERWNQSILELLEDLPPLFEPGFQPVLLSADVTDEHILVSKHKGRWELTGFVDFGDAMLGHSYYEFAAPGCCITRSSPALQRTMLLAYGFSEDQLNGTMARKLMAYTLIHRFINIPDLLKLFAPQQPTDFAALKRELWSFEHS
jgi:hygromycin-B 7''-O-kinase